MILYHSHLSAGNRCYLATESVYSIVLLSLHAIDCRLWLLAILGIGRQILNLTNKLLRCASDAVLPVYVLHQTLIVTLGFYVIQWNTAVTVKCFFVAIATLLSSLVIYEIVRRINVTRFLFGIKTRKNTAPVNSATLAWLTALWVCVSETWFSQVRWKTTSVSCAVHALTIARSY